MIVEVIVAARQGMVNIFIKNIFKKKKDILFGEEKWALQDRSKGHGAVCLL